MKTTGRMNYAITLVLLVVAMLASTGETRRVHHTNPLEELV